MNNTGLPNWFRRLVVIIWIVLLAICLLIVPRKVEAKNLNCEIEIKNWSENKWYYCTKHIKDICPEFQNDKN